MSDTKCADLLVAVRASYLRASKADLEERPLLGSVSAAVTYYQLLLAQQLREEIHVAYLDVRKRLIRSECVSIGSLSEAPFSAREICRRGLELGAGFLLLVHNHPSGDPTPSAADKSSTGALSRAAQLVGMEVVDHLIVARRGFCSLRVEGPEWIFCGGT